MLTTNGKEKDPVPDKTISEKLHEMLSERFGSDWRKDITLTHRVDDLYWLVKLAEEGLAERKRKVNRQSDASTIASIGSFQIDLENLLASIWLAITKPDGKRGKGKK